MCREVAWAELTVGVTPVDWIQSRALGFKINEMRCFLEKILK